MEFMGYRLDYEELYQIKFKKSTINKIVDLISSFREIEKIGFIIPEKLYLVYSSCMGDVMSYGAEGFMLEGVNEIIFIDPYTSLGKDRVISHELIHYFQNFMYFTKGLNNYNDWNEIMARQLENNVESILFKDCGISIKNISKDNVFVENFVKDIVYKSSDIFKDIGEFEEDSNRVINSIDDYFDSKMVQHLGLDSYCGEDDF